MTHNQILMRIRKLLALGQSDNQHEAEMAAIKASQIMSEHQISMSEIEVKDSLAQAIVEEEYIVAGQRMKLKWITTLGNACAVLFDGVVLNSNQLHGTKFVFVGYPDDIPMMKELFDHLYKSWFSIMERDLGVAKTEYRASMGFNFSPKDTMGFKQGHGVAFADSVYWRCKTLAKERKKNVSQTTTGKSLVLAKDKNLDVYGKEKGWVYTRRKHSSGSYTGQKAGQRAGQAIPLGGAIKGQTRRLTG